MVRVGVAGWDYADWEGIVYPKPTARGFDRLAFLASFFDVIEINVSFYRQSEAARTSSWATRVASNRSFKFTAKLFHRLTHPGSPPERTDGPASRARLSDEAATFREGLAPLVEARLLGAILMQFPHSFQHTAGNRRHLETLVALLPGLPLVAEFRHRSWDDEESLALLRRLDVGFCNIDQPAIGQTLGPTSHRTSRIAYIRLHAAMRPSGSGGERLRPRATTTSTRGRSSRRGWSGRGPWRRGRRRCSSSRTTITVARGRPTLS